jgi:hypothetical protein
MARRYAASPSPEQIDEPEPVTPIFKIECVPSIHPSKAKVDTRAPAMTVKSTATHKVLKPRFAFRKQCMQWSAAYAIDEFSAAPQKHAQFFNGPIVICFYRAHPGSFG